MDTRPSLVVRSKLIFNEILAIDSRLKQLGIEAEFVLEETKQMYVQYGEEPDDELKQFKSIVTKAKLGVFGEKDKCSSPIRCKFWNRGYCREGTNCAFYHPADDCLQHLQEGRCSSQGCQLRHRKICKYWRKNSVCFRKGQCQYLHIDDHEKSKDIVAEENLSREVEHAKQNKYIQVDEDKIETRVAEAPCDQNMKEGIDILDTNKIKLPCDLCSYKCKTKIIMSKHYDSKHEGCVECSVCGRKFISYKDRKTHEENMHS